MVVRRRAEQVAEQVECQRLDIWFVRLRGFAVVVLKAGAVCDAGEIVAVSNDETIGKIGGVPAVCEEKTRLRMTPSGPSKTRTGGTGCHAKAVRQSVDDAAGLRP